MRIFIKTDHKSLCFYICLLHTSTFTCMLLLDGPQIRLAKMGISVLHSCFPLFWTLKFSQFLRYLKCRSVTRAFAHQQPAPLTLCVYNTHTSTCTAMSHRQTRCRESGTLLNGIFNHFLEISNSWRMI